MFGSVTVQEGAPAGGAERQRRLLLGAALLLHHRDQLAGDEGEGHEHRGEHDARHREDDLDPVRDRASRRARRCAPKSSTKQRPATTGETENGRSMRVIRNALPRKSNLAIAQAAAMPKTALSGTAIAGDDQRQPDRRPRVGVAEGARPPRRRPRRSAWAKTATSGAKRTTPSSASTPPISSQPQPVGLGGGRAGARRGAATPAGTRCRPSSEPPAGSRPGSG